MSAPKQEITDTLKSYYDKLFQDGYLVCLHISRWGMGAQLNKKDLGVDEVNSLVRLGKKLLIEPAEISKFSNIEGKARRFVYSNSYRFPIAEAHFVPKTKIPTVIQKLNSYKDEYYKLVDKFIGEYDKLKATAKGKWPADLHEQLEKCYPAQDQVKSKFSFNVSIFEISMPKEFSDINIAELIEKEKINKDARREALEAAQAALKDQHERSLRQLEAFTQEAAKALRVQIVEMCKLVVGQIERKEAITRTSTQRILEQVENFRSLNFLNDSVVAAEITKLETIVNGGHNFRTDQEAIKLLNDQLTIVSTAAKEDADLDELTDNYFRAIKI
jgi:hypothetical protein